MDLRGWDERYRSREKAIDFDSQPTPLLVETARHLVPGKALDLACGTGRNAIWLARHGWQVTAVDGACSAVAALQQRAAILQLPITPICEDLEEGYRMEPQRWDFVAICYYLQRDLFEPAKMAVAPGGVLLSIVHITEGDEEPTKSRLRPGELMSFFTGWEVLHRYEGKPMDPAHKKSVAEIVARRPG